MEVLCEREQQQTMSAASPCEPTIQFMNLRGVDAEKPLIRDFLRRGSLAAAREALRQRTPSSDAASASFGLSLSAVSDEAPAPSPRPPERTPLRLFPLSPSVSEPARAGRGGVLSESESLHLKHAAEYAFVVPAIAAALRAVLAAHERFRRDGAETRRGRRAEGGRTRLAPFETSDAPAVSVEDYVLRLAEHTYVSPSVLLVACIYMDRVVAKKASLVLSPRNVFKLLATAVRAGSKIMDTRTLNNKSFAAVAGLGNAELNALEVHFMRCLELDLYVSPAEFYAYAREFGDCAAPQTEKAPPLKERLPPVAPRGLGGMGVSNSLSASLPVPAPPRRASYLPACANPRPAMAALWSRRGSDGGRETSLSAPNVPNAAKGIKKSADGGGRGVACMGSRREATSLRA